MKRIIEKYNQYVHHLVALVSLSTRLIIAIVFIPSGWGKLQHLDNTIQFFATLGIPMPQIQAPMVALIEFVGGALVAMGLLTRVTVVPLIGVMAVATLTAKWPEMQSALELVEATEFLYIALLGWLLASGPGVFSIDRLISRKMSS